MSTAATAEVTKGTAEAVVQTGRVFGEGGTDGLILYALILATFLMFLVAVFILWIGYRERKSLMEAKSAADADLAQAQRESAEALKEVATAVASSASADMTFKQSATAILGRVEVLLGRMERMG
jgi:flagellar biosynthesis/type III secretory pathway M-ring protein FliF/YscJ